VIFLNYETAEKEINEIINKSDEILEDIVKYLYENFDNYSWVGIYIVREKNLFLGPWIGPNATEHTKIGIGDGICGSAAETGKTEIIADVKEDSRYLSCFINTKSEIVVPIKVRGKVIAEIDIDSDILNAFSQKDKLFLEKVADMLSKHI